MKSKALTTLVLLSVALVALGSSVRATIVTPVYAIAKLSYNDGPPFNGYQFGVFDLDSPTGAPGSYQYAWTSLGSASDTALANLALNPQTSQMYLQYNFNEYRTIGTDGTLGGNLGGMNVLFGMAFDGTGGLYGVENATWYTLDGANGAINSTSVLSNPVYSQLGGGLTYATDGNFYFGNVDTLVSINPGGSVTNVGLFSGTGFLPFDYISMFSSGVNTYLLNADRLYQVDVSNASLDLLGTVTGLPVDFASGFTGAAAFASAPTPAVPEPGTWAAAALLLGGAGFMRWRRMRSSIVIRSTRRISARREAAAERLRRCGGTGMPRAARLFPAARTGFFPFWHKVRPIFLKTMPGNGQLELPQQLRFGL